MDYLKLYEDRCEELDKIEYESSSLAFKIKDLICRDKLLCISDNARYERLDLEEKIEKLKESVKNGLSR